jgi:hypothetical protein
MLEEYINHTFVKSKCSEKIFESKEKHNEVTILVMFRSHLLLQGTIKSMLLMWLHMGDAKDQHRISAGKV